MTDVTQPLSDSGRGVPKSADELLPLVYDELRKLAAARLAQEKPGQTLEATALVHEAYLRLAGPGKGSDWNSRGHFFAAAAEAMRRILVEQARRKGRLKRGGALLRHDVEQLDVAADPGAAEILTVHESLDKLELHNTVAAQLVKLRYFAGFTIREAAETLGVSPRKANQLWAYARAWLLAEIHQGDSNDSSSIA
jgi:RNA polymerase sigma factor (TIGR02999 family)